MGESAVTTLHVPTLTVFHIRIADLERQWIGASALQEHGGTKVMSQLDYLFCPYSPCGTLESTPYSLEFS